MHGEFGILFATSNVASFFPYDEDLTTKWLEELRRAVEKRDVDFFALHLQEFGGKSNVKVGECDRFIESINKCFCCLYDTSVSFQDRNLDNAEVYTALCSIYMWRKDCSVEIFNYENSRYDQLPPRHTKPKESACFLYNGQTHLSICVKFPLEMLPNRKQSRKGYTLTRFRLSRTGSAAAAAAGSDVMATDYKYVNAVNLHLVHDSIFSLDNGAAAAAGGQDSKLSIFAKYRQLQLNMLTAHVDSLQCQGAILCGDFNFRTCSNVLCTKLFYEQNVGQVELVSDHESVIRSTTNGKILASFHPKFSKLSPEYTPCWDNFSIYRQADVEGERIKLCSKFFEYPVNFLPTYCFDREGQSDLALYFTERLPSYCDRVFLLGTHFIKTVVGRNSPDQERYVSVASKLYIGDHEPVLLFLTL